jgi:DNA-binding NtrC family response regulator
MSLSAQTKVLRFTRKYDYKVGAEKDIKVDVRVIAAKIKRFEANCRRSFS